MRKIFFVLAVSLGLGGLAQAEEPQDQSAELQALKERIATLEAALKAKTATPTVDPSHIATLVHGQPTAYQCFLGDNPGMAPGNWVEVRNFNTEYYLALTVDGAPLIVMKPTANGRWEPLFPGRQDLTVLPPQSHCYFHAPHRLKAGNRLREYLLMATAYNQEMGSLPPYQVRLEGQPTASMGEPRKFRLAGQNETAVAIHWYDLN